MYLYFSFLYFDRSSSSPDMASSGTEKSAPFDLTPQSEFSSQESLLIETRLLTQVCSQTTYKTADLVHRQPTRLQTFLAVTAAGSNFLFGRN